MTKGYRALGMLVPAERQEDVRAEEHVASPELRQALAADALVPDELRGGRIGDGRDRRGRARSGWSRVARGRSRPAVGVLTRLPGREVPVLALAAVHRQLHGVAVGAVERLVPVQDGLHEVRPLRDRPRGSPAGSRGRSRRGSPRRRARGRSRRSRRSAASSGRSRPACEAPPSAVLRDDEEDASVEGRRAALLRKGDGKAQGSRRARSAGAPRAADGRRERAARVSAALASAAGRASLVVMASSVVVHGDYRSCGPGVRPGCR